MADIFHYLQINAPAGKIFEYISTPAGLDQWWTKKSSGIPLTGQEFEFHFSPEYNWTAIVSRSLPDTEFEFILKTADEDWTGTRVGFRLIAGNGITDIQFYHTGWKDNNQHFRISNYCWAMYLRILKRRIEHGESVAYDDRLNV